ncbi:alpha/beta fold hydrolase [Emcibacter sp.]|uniref:alpha/beta fold hydrolase n=1 Tax=Emcibacter sp. TaxID=1979954 RepID=UPI002AA6F9B2|nr:alpha/beta fold hydrolase [Emcibacter sp.]
MSAEYFPKNSKIECLQAPDGISLRIASILPEGPVRGQIVVVNGHREYLEKYQEFFQDLLDRGLQVFSMDLRGQGLSGRLLEDRHRSYINSFDLYLSDLALVLTHFGLMSRRNREKPLYLLGHSMGGHIAFRFLHDHPGVFDKAVLLSPMMGINLGPPLKAQLSRWLIKLACLLGFEKEYAPGQEPKTGEELQLLVSDLLTHDVSRYETESRIMTSNPDLYSGGATFGWLRAALQSIQTVRRPGYAEAVKLPLLAFLAEAERLVVNDTAHEVLKRLPNGRIEIVRGAYHEIYRETDEIRREMWTVLEEFLAV